MNKAEWINIIQDACIKAGTYEVYFDHVINTLAEILEKRDDVQAEYVRLGSMPVVKHTNKGGATNIVKNPLLILWDDLNKSALAYWRDLGLTPSGLKKIKGNVANEEKAESPLAKALRQLDG